MACLFRVACLSKQYSISLAFISYTTINPNTIRVPNINTNATNPIMLEAMLLQNCPITFLLFEICKMIASKNGVTNPYNIVVKKRAFTALIPNQCISMPKSMAIAMIV